MNKFVIVQHGYAIFGIGDTLDEAIADAREWVDYPELLVDLPNTTDRDGAFYWTRCTPALAAKVKAGIVDGFEEIEAGVLD